MAPGIFGAARPAHVDLESDFQVSEAKVSQMLQFCLDQPTIVLDMPLVLEHARPLISPHFLADLQKTAERINDDASDELDRLLDVKKRAAIDYSRITKDIQKYEAQGFAKVCLLYMRMQRTTIKYLLCERRSCRNGARCVLFSSFFPSETLQ